ncbi:MAG: hypothetical protein B9S32_02020 [Verrucomicrobia bacterium Tous-C9LFEB]|nr:MAG: hypothetical protein B9S32_02020 [Verrucomicrobia bacterium Tous-C9LFEB]
MKANRLFRFVALPLLFALLTVGLVRLFFLRFGPGDIYPPYSTLRADPMGSKALYAALQASGAVQLERNLNAIPKIKDPAHTTLFVIGLSQSDLGWTSKKESSVLEGFLHDGGTLVLSFKSKQAEKAVSKKEKSENKEDSEDESPKDEPAKTEKEKAKEKEIEEELHRTMVRLDKSWGIDFVTGKVDLEKLTDKKGESDKEGQERHVEFPIARLNQDDTKTLPSEISWHSALGFKEAPDLWYPVYTIDDRVVVAVRDMGKGRIILVSDSYLFSNESLRNKPQSALLAWLVGASTIVVFDESHHGIREQPGIATLARRYHLEGLALGALLLFILFIWKNTISFIPKTRAATSSDVILGRDSFSGLVNLLYHHISGGRLLEVCLQEWERSFAHKRKDATAKLSAARDFLKDNKNTPVIEGYRQLCAMLSERK